MKATHCRHIFAIFIVLSTPTVRAVPLCEHPCSSYAFFHGPGEDSYCQDRTTLKCYSSNDMSSGCDVCTQNRDCENCVEEGMFSHLTASSCSVLSPSLFHFPSPAPFTLHTDFATPSPPSRGWIACLRVFATCAELILLPILYIFLSVIDADGVYVAEGCNIVGCANGCEGESCGSTSFSPIIITRYAIEHMKCFCFQVFKGGRAHLHAQL